MIIVKPPGASFGERAVAWLLETASLYFGPIPGTNAHVDALFNTFKLRDEELSKPAGQRNEARLLQLTKRGLRLLTERSEVSIGHWGLSDAEGQLARPRRWERQACSSCQPSAYCRHQSLLSTSMLWFMTGVATCCCHL